MDRVGSPLTMASVRNVHLYNKRASDDQQGNFRTKEVTDEAPKTYAVYDPVAPHIMMCGQSAWVEKMVARMELSRSDCSSVLLCM